MQDLLELLAQGRKASSLRVTSKQLRTRGQDFLDLIQFVS